MAAASPVLLILGSGPKVGASVAKKFLNNGYRVATASRSKQTQQENDNELSIKLDLSKPQDIPAVFVKVKETFGVAPSVVVHNSASVHPGSKESPFSNVQLDHFNQDMAVNATSVLIAAKSAVEGFETLPSNTKKTFIFTGNALAVMALPSLLTFGMGKAAGAHLIMSAASAYKDKGYRFYFGDERNPDGSPCVQGTDGDAHAEAYSYLAELDKQDEWYYTFTKGDRKYVDFGGPKL